MDEDVRGSEKLRGRYSKEDLEALLGIVIDDPRLIIDDGFPLGTPWPDGASIIVRTNPEAAAEFVAKSLLLNNSPVVRVLKKGLPPAEMFVELQITAGSAVRM